MFLPPDPRAEAPYRVRPEMAFRIAVLAVVAAALFAALFFRLWALQVISGEQYRELARDNRVRTFRIQAPRGAIVDRNGEVLVSNTSRTAVRLWPSDLPPRRRKAVVRRLGALLGVRPATVLKAIREHERDPLVPITLKIEVGEERVRYLLEHQAQFPGVQVDDVEVRHYKRGSLAAQLLGYVGEISREQLKRKAEEGYAPGDRIGQAGVEAAYDRFLRGTPGTGDVLVDAGGRVKGDRKFRELPEPGETLRLTIDADVQAAAERALRDAVAQARENGEWAANGGAIVAMDPRNGEILALASHPTFDPAIYVGRVDVTALKRLAAPDGNYPTLNRPIQGVYPPGSTFKPVTALSAMQEGALTPMELVQCSPQRNVDGTIFRNWTYMNEPMTLATALAASCDTYFYEVGLRFYRMPAERGSPLQRWANRMGFGRPTGIDLGPESAGLLPTPAWRRRAFETEIDRLWKSGDSVQLAIGQKDMLVTPLQMARFYALIANGGKLVQPHVGAAIEQGRNEGDGAVVVRDLAPKPPREVGLDRASLRVVQQGLYDATHESYGTSAGIFSSFPIPIAGKTGTAEKVVKVAGRAALMDQAWWCGYGPVETPEIVVCSLAENGGFGGAVAAPAALAVFEEYFGVQGGPIGPVNSD